MSAPFVKYHDEVQFNWNNMYDEEGNEYPPLYPFPTYYLVIIEGPVEKRNDGVESCAIAIAEALYVPEEKRWLTWVPDQDTNMVPISMITGSLKEPAGKVVKWAELPYNQSIEWIKK